MASDPHADIPCVFSQPDGTLGRCPHATPNRRIKKSEHIECDLIHNTQSPKVRLPVFLEQRCDVPRYTRNRLFAWCKKYNINQRQVRHLLHPDHLITNLSSLFDDPEIKGWSSFHIALERVLEKCFVDACSDEWASTCLRHALDQLPGLVESGAHAEERKQRIQQATITLDLSSGLDEFMQQLRNTVQSIVLNEWLQWYNQNPQISDVFITKEVEVCISVFRELIPQRDDLLDQARQQWPGSILSSNLTLPDFVQKGQQIIQQICRVSWCQFHQLTDISPVLYANFTGIKLPLAVLPPQVQRLDTQLDQLQGCLPETADADDARDNLWTWLPLALRQVVLLEEEHFLRQMYRMGMFSSAKRYEPLDLAWIRTDEFLLFTRYKKHAEQHTPSWDIEILYPENPNSQKHKILINKMKRLVERRFGVSFLRFLCAWRIVQALRGYPSVVYQWSFEQWLRECLQNMIELAKKPANQDVDAWLIDVDQAPQTVWGKIENELEQFVATIQDISATQRQQWLAQDTASLPPAWEQLLEQAAEVPEQCMLLYLRLSGLLLESAPDVLRRDPLRHVYDLEELETTVTEWLQGGQEVTPDGKEKLWGGREIFNRRAQKILDPQGVQSTSPLVDPEQEAQRQLFLQKVRDLEDKLRREFLRNLARHTHTPLMQQLRWMCFLLHEDLHSLGQYRQYDGPFPFHRNIRAFLFAFDTHDHYSRIHSERVTDVLHKFLSCVEQSSCPSCQGHKPDQDTKQPCSLCGSCPSCRELKQEIEAFQNHHNMSWKEFHQIMALAALSHDFGKLLVPREVLLTPELFKPDKFPGLFDHQNPSQATFDDKMEEWRVWDICRHVIDGAVLLAYYALPESKGASQFPPELRPFFPVARQMIMDATLYHHEKYDGQGYYYRLQGKEIPLVARLLAIVDSFDAMNSPRPYRSAGLSEDIIYQEMKKTHQCPPQRLYYDERVFACFWHCLMPKSAGQDGPRDPHGDDKGAGPMRTSPQQENKENKVDEVTELQKQYTQMSEKDRTVVLEHYCDGDLAPNEMWAVEKMLDDSPEWRKAERRMQTARIMDIARESAPQQISPLAQILYRPAVKQSDPVVSLPEHEFDTVSVAKGTETSWQSHIKSIRWRDRLRSWISGIWQTLWSQYAASESAEWLAQTGLWNPALIDEIAHIPQPAVTAKNISSSLSSHLRGERRVQYRRTTFASPGVSADRAGLDSSTDTKEAKLSKLRDAVRSFLAGQELSTNVEWQPLSPDQASSAGESVLPLVSWPCELGQSWLLQVGIPENTTLVILEEHDHHCELHHLTSDAISTQRFRLRSGNVPDRPFLVGTPGSSQSADDFPQDQMLWLVWLNHEEVPISQSVQILQQIVEAICREESVLPPVPEAIAKVVGLTLRWEYDPQPQTPTQAMSSKV